ncbi:hypothetical protein BpHYR1_029920 [Brachionus plicatilis]|uniref:Uncharacterized protein n=1 Tax=Brachionus plicatilis TaxID=10195 RepID=A0A3M7Q639_BRAPC|nr:hypothetical protein BpHYR1_029920 [Brachionus plicatilis]
MLFNLDLHLNLNFSTGEIYIRASLLNDLALESGEFVTLLEFVLLSQFLNKQNKIRMNKRSCSDVHEMQNVHGFDFRPQIRNLHM